MASLHRSTVVSAGFAALALHLVAGCAARQPQVSISDPAIFTALHLRAAQVSLATQSGRPGNTLADMDRYLRTPASDYESKQLRMDEMLDATQRGRAVAQSVLSRLSVELDLLSNLADDLVPEEEDSESEPDNETDDDAGAGDTERAEALNQAIKDLSARVGELAANPVAASADSPFDMVDRAQDFYTTVLHKSLRNFGTDSHIVPPAQTLAILQAYEKLSVARGTLAAAEERYAQALTRSAQSHPNRRDGAEAALRAAYRLATTSDLPSPAPQSKAGAGAAQAETQPPNSGDTTASEQAATPVSPTVAPQVAMGVPTRGSVLADSAMAIQDRSTPFISNFVTESLSIDGLKQGMSTEPLQAPPPQWRFTGDRETNEAARKAFEAAEAAAKAQKDTAAAQEKTAQAQEKAALARRDAAKAETETAAQQLKKVETEIIKTGEVTRESDRQEHAQTESWYAKLLEASAKLDAPPEYSPEVAAAHDALKAAIAEMQKATSEFNCVVGTQRKSITGPFVTSPPPAGERLIVLLFQAHVQRGLAPNHMVGLRAQVTGATRDCCSKARDCCPDQQDKVRILRLHPTRNYDREDTLFAEQISEQLLLNVSGRFGSSVNGDVARELASEAAEKQRFMSRIPKVASWADAANREFGWDFYPNNLTVRRRAPLSRVPGIVYGPAARTFEVVAHLDPGARDCAVYLIVPTDMTSITLELSMTTADIDQRLFGGSERQLGANHTVVIPLPKFHSAEWKANLGSLSADLTGALVLNHSPASTSETKTAERSRN